MRLGSCTRVAVAIGLMGFAAAAPLVGQGAPAAGSGRGGRVVLEQRVRQRIYEVVRTRVGLTSAQMVKLRAVNNRYESQRRQLVAEERQIRMALRAELLAGDTAHEEHVSQLIDQFFRVQRLRIDVLEQEQRALADFMSPVQRAKYLSVQDQVRRMMDQMRRAERPDQHPPGPGASPALPRP